MSLRKQTLALLTGILLIVGQLMVVVHSAEHPFHTADAQCAVYQHAEQNHANIVVVNTNVETVSFQVHQALLVQTAYTTRFNSYYLPRAPPVS